VRIFGTSELSNRVKSANKKNKERESSALRRSETTVTMPVVPALRRALTRHPLSGPSKPLSISSLQPHVFASSSSLSRCRHDASRSPTAHSIVGTATARALTTSSSWGSGGGDGGGSADHDGHDDGDHSHLEGGTFGITSSFSSRIPKPHKWNMFPDGSRFWKPIPHTMRKQRPIFVAATRQHVGKTTTSLAIMSGLKKRYDKVGFLKPVGQQHVPVISKNRNEEIRVDKDCVLVHEHFQLNHIDYEDMSPVIIPQGYTKKFVDGEISLNEQVKDVLRAMDNVAKASDVVLLEGTGHCAVGSIVGLNNAKVASLVGADMVLVANGGLGSAFDELELNRVLCQHFHVRIAGVIINKVIPDKYESTKVHHNARSMGWIRGPLQVVLTPTFFSAALHGQGHDAGVGRPAARVHPRPGLFGDARPRRPREFVQVQARVRQGAQAPALQHRRH
jgi:dethiobiotin synthetase